MNQKSGDNLQIPAIKPAKDELASRRGGSQRPRQGGEPNNSSGGNLLALMALIIAIAATGAAYFLWQQNTQLLETVSQADERIARLESQLASTGDELTQSDAAVRVQLKELGTEVAKLWDARKVSNKKIKAHDTSIKNLTTRTGKLGDGLKNDAQQLTVLSAEIDELIEELEKIEPDKISSRFNELTALKDSHNALASDVKDNSQWLLSIDEFRRQVNQRLNAIQNPAAQPPQLQ